MSRIRSCFRWAATCAALFAGVAVSPIRAFAQGTELSPQAAVLLGQAANKEDSFAILRQHYGCVFKNTKFTTHTVRIFESFYVNGYEIQRLLAVNGVALTGAQKDQEEGRVRAEIETDKQKSPPVVVGLAGGMVLSPGPHRFAQTVEGSVVRTSIFQNEQHLMYHGRQAIQLDFTGDRKLKAQTDEERVAKALSGTIVLDEETGAILRIGAEAVDDVTRRGSLLVVHGAHIGFDASKVDDSLFLPSSWTSFHMVSQPFKVPAFYPDTEDFWLQGCKQVE
jgi:hypothetical protein